MKKTYYIVMFVLSFCSCQKEMPNTYTRTAQVDVYVAGHVFDGKNSFGIYWKNGNPVSLTDCSDASSITVAGSDVYVGGDDGGGAKYWKNGSPVTLSVGSKLGWTTSIAVSGNDVYVAGVEYISGGNVHAVYWKNGQPTYLPENTRSVQNIDNYPISSTESKVHSIFISGSDVYVAGQETISKMISPYPSPSYITGISALYWKNGNAVYLIQGSFYGSKDDAANSISVAGQDVYACGAWEARYWKNGTSFYLPGSSGITTTANSVFVSGSDVYVAGTQKDGKSYQTYLGQQKRYVA